MRRPHFLGLRLRQFNLDQLTLPDARTQRPGLMPPPTARQQLRPKREGPALDRLHGMDTAPPALQKHALGMARNPQAQQIPCTERKPLLEFGLPYPDKLGDPLRVSLGQIDKPLLVTTVGAPGLAFEPHVPKDTSDCWQVGENDNWWREYSDSWNRNSV